MLDIIQTPYRTFCSRTSLEYKEYQHTGVTFCQNAERSSKCRGGLLADEMGLGKTIIMLGLITCRFTTRTLIVLPLALLSQWQNIIKTRLGHTALVYHGSSRKKYTKEDIEQAPIVLTTYGQIAKHIPREGTARLPAPSVLKGIEWSRVIFDEGHHLRNSRTGRYKGAMEIRAQCRWIVTGTPIQNRMSDFHALCAQMGFTEAFYKNPANLKAIAKNHILRRTKKGVGIELPLLKQHIVSQPWNSTGEHQLAMRIHKHAYNTSSREDADDIIPELGPNKLTMMIRARQICVCPPLLLP